MFLLAFYSSAQFMGTTVEGEKLIDTFTPCRCLIITKANNVRNGNDMKLKFEGNGEGLSWFTIVEIFLGPTGSFYIESGEVVFNRNRSLPHSAYDIGRYTRKISSYSRQSFPAGTQWRMLIFHILLLLQCTLPHALLSDWLHDLKYYLRTVLSRILSI